MEMTRQRVRPSLKRAVFESCKYCGGTGSVASMESCCLNIIRKIRLWVTQRKPVLRVQVNSKIADYMNNHKRSLLIDLEHQYDKRIYIGGLPDIPLGEIRLSADQDVRPEAAKRS